MSGSLRQFKEKYLNSFHLTHSLFVFFLLFELIFLNSEIYSGIIFLVDKQDLAVTLVFSAYLVASLYFLYKFFALALNSDWKFKVLYFLFFSVAVFYEYGYQKALGRFSSFSDIENVFSTNLEHKFSAAASYVSYLALVPCIVFLICLVSDRAKNNPLKFKGLLAIVLSLSFFYFQVSLVSAYFLENKSPIVSIDAFCRATADFGVWGSFSNGMLTEREILPKPPLEKDFRPTNNIVYVVDESMLGDHLSINGYNRDTTPFLRQLEDQGVLHNWGIAAAATTASHTTYEILIAGLQPDDFPDRTNVKLYTSPNIYQYAKAMNYKTYFFDGQMSTFWGGINDDRNYIDSWSGVDLSEKVKIWDIDKNIAKRVNQIISTSTGNFIFIFKHGNHIPYHKNFPAEASIWKPSYVSNHKFEIPGPEKLEEVKNSYDNCIRFNLDSFFQNLVNDYSKIPNDSVFIYTGDHGQTLYANGMASHGGLTRKEATVPLFIIGDLGVGVDTKYRASHSNIFATVLDLMNYPNEYRQRKYAISLLDAEEKDSRTRYYNPNKNKRIAFD